MTEKEKLVSIRAEIPNDLKLQFKAKCALSGSDMRTELIKLIKEYVEEK